MADASPDKLELARTRGRDWGRQVASAVIPVVGAHSDTEVLKQALGDVNVEVQRLAEELAAREGQAVALVWREAAVEALRCELVAFDALCARRRQRSTRSAPDTTKNPSAMMA